MLDRIERILVAGNRWLLILLLLAMACIVFANVVLRYTTGDSIVWAEEVARHMMIWVTFLGAGLVLRFGGHVAIDNLHRSVSTRKAQAMRGFVVLILAIFFAVMTVTSSQYVYATRFQTTAATDIPISYIYGAMPVGFVLMLIHLLFIARGYITAGSFAESDEMDADGASMPTPERFAARDDGRAARCGRRGRHRPLLAVPGLAPSFMRESLID
jgi:TRAP-type C4-dicarboxylate transport system permease small subunit